LFPGVGGGTTQTWRLVALAAVPILILQNYTRALTQAASEFGVTNFAWLLGPLLNVCGNGSLVLAGLLTVHRAVLIWLAGQVVATAVMVGFHCIRVAPFSRPDARLARSMAYFGLKSHAADVMMVGNYRL